VGLFPLCSKEIGVFSNEIATAGNTLKIADKREKDADVLPIKIKCNIREYYPKRKKNFEASPIK
jgi:hypothetical protein